MTNSLDMDGPYVFSISGIDNNIATNKIGNYALGSKNQNGTFIVSYVGRSDNDLNLELKQRLQTYDHPIFKASYANSAKDAYEKECKNYHDFDPSKNEIHPAKPSSVHRCPICGT